MEIIWSKDVPTFPCIFCKYSGDKYGVRESRFGHIFGRSKNHPKSIAIDQESLINHFGINKIPQNPNHYIKNKEKQTKNEQTYKHTTKKKKKRKQTNKQTNKQNKELKKERKKRNNWTNRKANKHRNKQTNKQIHK